MIADEGREWLCIDKDLLFLQVKQKFQQQLISHTRGTVNPLPGATWYKNEYQWCCTSEMQLPRKVPEGSPKKERKTYPNGIATNNSILGKVIVLLQPHHQHDYCKSILPTGFMLLILSQNPHSQLEMHWRVLHNCKNSTLSSQWRDRQLLVSPAWQVDNPWKMALVGFKSSSLSWHWIYGSVLWKLECLTSLET